MTETTNVTIPAQAGPPLADTSDMAQLHKVFRNAVNDAPRLIASATDAGRVELVATYYDNVLELLHVHHDGEDELLWPKLCERAPAEAQEVQRIAGQHGDVVSTLAAAQDRLAAWRTAPSPDTAAAATDAVAALGAALLPHLDEEEAYIVPLAAQHIYAPEWGELPGHAMRSFGGDKLWLILGLVREQMRPDQIAMQESKMPPPLLAMWNEQGSGAYEQFIAELRAGA